MTNHVRTLLLNLPAVGGEEYVPATYVPAVLPQLLRDAREALFGNPTDRTQLGSRVDRLLAYAHTTAFAPELTAADSRITYDPTAFPPAYDPDPYPFAAAASASGLDGVFHPATSSAEAAWWETWTSAAPAPVRAVALALALAARTADLAGVT